MFLKFECPECKANEFEEVLIDCWCVTPAEGMEHGDMIFCGRTRIEDGQLDGYQCAHCGERIPAETSEELEQWLRNLECNKKCT